MVVPVSDLLQVVKEAQIDGVQAYRSYYFYNEEGKKYIEENKSIEGFNGYRELPYILLDIDGDDRIVDSACKTLLSWGIPEGSGGWQIYFSGKKGYHIHFPNIFGFTPEDIPETVKYTLNKYFPQADPRYFGSSLVRLEGTIHKETGAYKTVVPYKILSLDAIPEGVPEPVLYEPNKKWCEKVVSLKEVPVYPEPGPNGSSNAKSSYVTCVQNMREQGPVEGTIHNTMLRVASSWRRAGVDQETIINLLSQWSPQSPTEKIAKRVVSVFDKPYEFSCHDPVMAEHCDPKCVFFERKNFSTKVQPIESDDVDEHYQDMEAMMFSQKDPLIDLGKMFDSRSFILRRGEAVLVPGDTGIGKTAIMQNIALKVAPKKVLFFNLEISKGLFFRRLLQISQNMTKQEVYKHYSRTWLKGLANVRVVNSKPNKEEILRSIRLYKPDVMFIDTSSDIRGMQKDEQEASNEIALTAHSIVQQSGVAAFIIHHISKDAAIKGTVNVHSGKGSSTWEQKMDQVLFLTFSRGLHNLRSLKARDESPLNVAFSLDWNTFRIDKLWT